jgi:MFS family permease
LTAIHSVQDAILETKLSSKISWRLLPFLLLCYTFAYLDRVNIGFAKLQMQTDLGMSDAVYGLGAGIFFLGYVLLEIPSNLLLPKIGARKTMGRIMILWGITSASMMLVHNASSFYIVRFLLGLFEAGFAPGMIFYLTYWYSQDRMARVMAIVMLAGPIGGTVGGPLSAWLMTALAGAHGLTGWQWLFLIEGLPCVLLGLLAMVLMVDRPAAAKWLTDAEKLDLAKRLVASPAHAYSFRQILHDPQIYLMSLTYFCIISGLYTVSFWLPSILRADGVTSTISIGFLSAIPYVVSALSMYALGRSSDRTGERRLHSAIPATLGAIFLTGATLASGSLSISLICMTVATSMIWVAYTVFWALPSRYLKGDGAAGGIALINTLGLLGGFVSPSLIGWVRSATGSMQAGLYVMAGLLLLAAALLMVLRASAPMHALTITDNSRSGTRTI